MKRVTREALDNAAHLLNQVQAAAAKTNPRAIVITPAETTALAEAWMHLAELEERL